MPSDKRIRQRENRRRKQERMAKVAQRRKFAKRGGIGLVIVAIIVGIAFALNGGSSKNKGSSSTTVAQVSYPCTPLPNEKTGPIHFSNCPPMTIDKTSTYTAEVTTDVGSFTITLDPKSAPIAVNNFVFLAEHGFYNDVTFQRVIPGFMMQGGDPTGTGAGGPGYEFTEHGPPKAKNASQQYPNYSVAMANSSTSTDPSTNGSQFFVVDGPSGESLPPNYVLFGSVTSGQSVVDKIVADGNSNPQSNGVPPKVTHTMTSVVISVNGKKVPPIATTTTSTTSTTTSTTTVAPTTTAAPATGSSTTKPTTTTSKAG